MRRRDRIPEQLDIPLVWEAEENAEPSPAPKGGSLRQAGEAARPGWGRLVLAAVADAGLALLFAAAAGLLAMLAGANLDPPQLVVAAVAGVEILSVVNIAVLWAWRGTIGMLLMGVTFSVPFGFGQAGGVWALCAASLPLAGVPLVLGRRGLERLAGSQLKCR